MALLSVPLERDALGDLRGRDRRKDRGPNRQAVRTDTEFCVPALVRRLGHYLSRALNNRVDFAECTVIHLGGWRQARTSSSLSKTPCTG